MSGDRQRRGTSLRALRGIADLPVAIALLFAFTLAAPRAPLLYHTHAGGGHAHVHGGADLGARDASPRAAARQVDRRPAYASDHGEARGHVHQQQRYQAAVVAALPFVPSAVALAALRSAPPRGAPARAVHAASARAPPLLAA